jgi:hypothetical protein
MTLEPRLGVEIVPESDLEYDVCLSFAGEDRDYVSRVADHLRGAGIRVFYDEYETVELWGKDLYEHFDHIYREAAGYCVLFVSSAYAEKVWTNHERRSAQARALRENREYVLPARFDDTPIPGLRETIGFIDLSEYEPEECASLIIEKLGPRPRKNYFPPVPDRLFSALEVEEDEEEVVQAQAQAFLRVLQRMTHDERHVVMATLIHGCAAELPENVHVNLDLLQRVTGAPKTKLFKLLGNVRSLGFTTYVREDDSHADQVGGSDELVVLEWDHLSSLHGGNATAVARGMIRGAMEGYCDHHAEMALRNLDFSQLASATAVDEEVQLQTDAGEGTPMDAFDRSGDS